MKKSGSTSQRELFLCGLGTVSGLFTSPSLRTVWSRTNPVSILSFPRRALVLFSHLSLGLPEFLPFSFLPKICLSLMHPSQMQYTLHPFFIVQGKGTNDEFLIMIYSPVCCDCLTFKLKYAPQRPVFSLCSSLILRGCFTPTAG